MKKKDMEIFIKKGSKKLCKKCMKELPYTSFYIKVNKENGRCRFNSPCKSCAHKNRNIDYQKSYHRKVKYNLTEAEFQQRMESQQHCCAICGIHSTQQFRQFSVDHCHTTGKTRGILCHSCNVGIGFLKDNVNIMIKAIEYIKSYQ